MLRILSESLWNWAYRRSPALHEPSPSRQERSYEETHDDRAHCQTHWETFFNDFAKKHHGYEARLEVISRDFGDQEVATWLPFSGISYDPHHHQIFITVGGISSHYPVHLTHTIDTPCSVEVRDTPDGEASILVVSEDKTEILVTLRRQPQLTA